MPKNHIFVRPVAPADTQMFFDWSKENSADNEFDPEVARAPSTFVLCAYDKSGPLAYQPIQQVFVLDSFAPRPGLTKLQRAAAMKALTEAAVTQAHLKGVGEIMFLGTEEGTNSMAEKHLFEKLPHSVYRVKIKDLSCS